jgi:hypothetical protein
MIKLSAAFVLMLGQTACTSAVDTHVAYVVPAADPTAGACASRCDYESLGSEDHAHCLRSCAGVRAHEDARCADLQPRPDDRCIDSDEQRSEIDVRTIALVVLVITPALIFVASFVKAKNTEPKFGSGVGSPR